METNEQRTLIGFYVNGEESAASKWLDKVNFDIRSQLEFKSEGADLNVKSVRIYNKALTSDECLTTTSWTATTWRMPTGNRACAHWMRTTAC